MVLKPTLITKPINKFVINLKHIHYTNVNFYIDRHVYNFILYPFFINYITFINFFIKNYYLLNILHSSSKTSTYTKLSKCCKLHSKLLYLL